MVMVAVFVGSFDGEEIDEFEFPQVPRVGDLISIRNTKRIPVEAVHYHVGGQGTIARILLPHLEV